MKCQYCGREMEKGLKMHEKFCKSKPTEQATTEDMPIVAQDAPEQEITTEATKDIPIKQELPISCPGIFSRLFRRQPKIKQSPIKADSVNEIISRLPKWSIRESKPMFVGASKKRKLIQFVGVSKLKPPVMAWVFWDGIYISVEDRLYQPPHDIRGDVFFYDLDNSRPLLDNLKADEKIHESLRMAQVKNIAYAMGRIAGANDLLKNLGLILIGIGVVLLVVLLNTYMTWQVAQGFEAANGQIGNVTRAVTNYMTSHP